MSRKYKTLEKLPPARRPIDRLDLLSGSCVSNVVLDTDSVPPSAFTRQPEFIPEPILLIARAAGKTPLVTGYVFL